MYRFILTEEDMKSVSHFPIIALVNETYNDDMEQFIMGLCQHVGRGYDYVVCYCWDELDEYDKENTPYFEGLTIATEDGEEIILSYEEVYDYLSLALSRMTEIAPDLSVRVKALLDRFKQTFSIEAES